MKEHSNTLRNTIIGTVVGGLLVSLILWFVGFLPTVWGWIVKAIAIFWGWLTTDTSMPIWLILIAVFFMLPTFARIYHYYRQKAQSSVANINDTDQDDIRPEDQFNELEMKILHVLSKADGERLTVHDISQRAQESQIRAQHALDTLNEKGLLQLSLNYVYGTGFFLNRHGRELVIELGIA